MDDFLLNLLGGVIGSMAAEIVYKKWFGGKRTKIVMGVLVFMLLAVASPLTAKVSKADTPAATEKPVAREGYGGGLARYWCFCKKREILLSCD